MIDVRAFNVTMPIDIRHEWLTAILAVQKPAQHHLVKLTGNGSLRICYRGLARHPRPYDPDRSPIGYGRDQRRE